LEMKCLTLTKTCKRLSSTPTKSDTMVAASKMTTHVTRAKDFGMHLDGKHLGEIFIPFKMEGTTVYFESRAPTWQEIEELPHIEMTSVEVWNQKEVQLQVNKVTETGPCPTIAGPCPTNDGNWNQWDRLNQFDQANRKTD
jgi:hypothetical protein